MNLNQIPLYLASRSPRRRELLLQLGLAHACVPVDLDETPLAGEEPRAYVERMALSKARAGARAGRLTASMPRLVIGADTAVVCDDRILGKPVDADDALAMLGLLSGREHRVLTGVALIGVREHSAISETLVYFRHIEPAEAAAYWASGEPCDKAGAYAIQGQGALFVERIDGSYSGVVGLPLFETAALLACEGVTVIA